VKHRWGQKGHLASIGFAQVDRELSEVDDHLSVELVQTWGVRSVLVELMQRLAGVQRALRWVWVWLRELRVLFSVRP
jgi:hypothetical protein